MASNVVVFDSRFRKVTVKTEPGTYISDILEKGCEQLGVKAERYILKHNKKPIDMTRTFRQSGLSPGAKLELVQASKSAAPVSVALQLPESLANGIPNGRLTGKFSSATTFWQILRQFESDEGRNLNITGRGMAQTLQGDSGAGRVFYEQPVCQVMGRELSNIQDLQRSLASLGFNSGSCMIRLNFRVIGTPLEEAMAEISQYFKSIESEEPQKPEVKATSDIPKTEELNKGSQEDVEMGEGQEAEKQEDLMDFNEKPLPELPSEPTQAVPDSAPQSSTPTAAPPSKILGPGNREITVFSAPTDSTPRAALQASSDADFEATLAHVKLHESRIKGESRNKRLPTAAEAQKLAQEKAAKQAAIKSVEIKLRFPDQTQTSAKFTHEDTAKDLYDHAKALLRDDIEGEPFTLSWFGENGMRVVPKDGSDKLIKDLGFTGRILITLNWEQSASNAVRDGRDVLKAEYRKTAQDIMVPEVPNVVEDENEEPNKGKGKAPMTGGGDGNQKKGMPKWFRGVGKKN